MHSHLRQLVCIVVASAGLCAQSGWAQSVDTSRFKRHHEKVSLDRCLGVLQAHPELYGYVCQDETRRRVLRVSPTPLGRPGGKHPQASPEIPDLELDLYGLTTSQEAIDFLTAYVAAHNKRVADYVKQQKAIGERKPVLLSVPDLLERVDYRRQEKQHAAANQAAPSRQPTGTRQEYQRIAVLLTYDHRLSGRIVAPPVTPAAVEPLRKSSSAQIQRAAELLARGLDEIEKNRGSGARAAEAAARNAEETRAAADRGEFTEKGVYYDYDDRGNLRKNEYEIDRGLMPVVGSSLAAGIAAGVAPEMEQIRGRLYLDGARTRGWDEMLPEMADQHAGPLTKRQLVRIEFLADGPGGQPLSKTRAAQTPFGPSAADTFQGRYVATNLAPRDLHNVTLAIDMYHYTTLPIATLRHVYFVPVWKAGEQLELSRSFFGDLERGGKFYSVPAAEEKPGGIPGVSPELEGLAGMVRMQSTLWSDEARQAAQMHELPERARAISRVLIRYAERAITASWAITGPKIERPKHLPASTRDPATERMAEETTQLTLGHFLRPVLEILPADSAEVRYATRMLTDFRPVREEVLQKREAALIAACGEGKRYTGTWAAPGYFGELGIVFLSCDSAGTRIRAELFDNQQPELRRLVAGYIGGNWRSQDKLVMLEPVLKDQGPSSGHVLDQAIQSYTFKLKEGQLIGEASRITLENGGGYDGTQRPINLEETTGDATELAAAKRRDQAAPQHQPKPPPAATAAAGRAATPAEIIAGRKQMSQASSSPAPSAPASRAPAGSVVPSPPKGSPLAGSPPSSNTPFGSSPLGGKPAFPSGFSPFGGFTPPGSVTDDKGKSKKMTPAEARAKAQADAVKEKMALQSLSMAKQAIASKDRNTARVQLQYTINVAPGSPAGKQAAKLLEQLDKD